MKLSKKADPVRTYTDTTEYKKGEPFNPRTMSLIHDQLLPFGKYKGRTVEEVMEDHKYWRWMNDNNLITSWGLCTTIIKSPVQKQSTYLVDSDGHQWVGIREVEMQCEPSKWL